MFPMRFATIFKNRWMALIWAAGIVWFAYDFAVSEPTDQGNNSIATDANGAPISDQDTNKIAEVLGD